MAPLPDPTKPFSEQDPVVLLAICIWGEARSEGSAGQEAVGCVVRNRVGYQGRFGEGFPGVILKPWQFSSFNANDPNREKLLMPLMHDSEQIWESCYTAAHGVYWGDITDPTGGAVFYWSPPLTAAPRAWGPVIETYASDNLHFCREQKKAA